MNKEVIAINQDKAGKQGTRIINKETYEVWKKTLSNGHKVLLIFNKKNEDATIQVDWTAAGEKSGFNVRDLWDHSDKGFFENSYVANVSPHGVSMIRLSKN